MSDKFSFSANLKYDVPASVVVFFVAVPLCLGIALASGAPLYAGLIAGVCGGIVVGLISNSALGVSGPAAGLAVIVLTSIQQLGAFEIFLVAVVLAGVFQLIMGLTGAGIIGYYFPSSVIKGMLTAIGVIIILKQIPHAAGYDADYEGDMSFRQADGYNTFSELTHMLNYISPAAILVAVVSLVILLLWDLYLVKKHFFFRLVQGPLVAVAFGIVYEVVTRKYYPNWALQAEHLVNVPVAGSFSGFVSNFTFPQWSAWVNPDVWVVALTLAIVASLETLLSVEATDRMDPLGRKTNTNRELLAQGAGNICSGLIGGLPVTQVIIRSSANIQSGARSRLSAILHGVLLLVCVVTIPHILNLIPLAVLAAILLVVGYKLAKPSLFREMYVHGWSQFLPFMATILGVVFTDLLKGIGIGLGVAVLVILRNSYRNSHALHKETANSNILRIVLAEEVIFLNKAAIARQLEEIPAGSCVIIDMSKNLFIDHDVKELIDKFIKNAPEKNMQVELIENPAVLTNRVHPSKP
ncbi:MAG: membrane protein [Cyclobacteriaceae bacterium]|nr:MAG: membrane protein [Cyclobacteriaceae bacterium]